MAASQRPTVEAQCGNCGDSVDVRERYADDFEICDRCRDAQMRDRLARAFESGDDDVFGRVDVASRLGREVALPITLPESGDVVLSVETRSRPHGREIKKLEKLTRTECDCGCDEARYSYETGHCGGMTRSEECLACGKMHVDQFRTP